MLGRMHSAVFDVTYGGARNATRKFIGAESGRTDGLLGLLPPSGGLANSPSKPPSKSPSKSPSQSAGGMARVGDMPRVDGHGHHGDESLPRWRRRLRWAREQLVAIVSRLPRIGRN